MGIYTYRCKKCSAVFQDLITMSKRDDSVDCEVENCDGKANRDIDAELAAVGKRAKWVLANERWSRSIGVPVKQLAEFRKRFPTSVYDERGRLLIKSRKHKLQELKARGMVELDNRK